MKKVLLASTALLLSASVASADMTLSGDGRMGILKRFGTDDIGFTSRFRAIFTGTGETDGGLAFGGTIRADNAGGISFEDQNGDTVVDPDELVAGGGAAGVAGSIFISGDFGTLTMGDVSGAPEAAVGDVSGVGLTGLGDLNEMTYLSNAGSIDRPSARYDYTFGDFGVHVSADNPYSSLANAIGADQSIAWGVAATYSSELFSAGLGYEDKEDAGSHIIGSLAGTFAGFTLKGIYGVADLDGAADDYEQYGISADYTFDATTLTAFYVGGDEELKAEGYGIGASYDLGGGAAVQGGWAQNETTDDDSFDFGVSMTF